MTPVLYTERPVVFEIPTTDPLVYAVFGELAGDPPDLGVWT